MTMRFIDAMIAVGAMLIFNPALAQDVDRLASQGWSERGVFAFGNFAADFEIGQASGWGFGPADLNDCSDAAVFCADGGIFTIVLPKLCSDFHQHKAWSKGGITTELLWTQRDENVSPHGPRPVEYWLGNGDRQNVVFVYRVEGGITAIVTDAPGRRDLVTLARSGELARIYREGGSRQVEFDRLRRGLSTFDPMGRCGPVISPNAEPVRIEVQPTRPRRAPASVAN